MVVPGWRLGIYETRRGRPVWRQQADGRWRLTERFESNFVDLAGGHGLLGQTAGRTKKAVTAWLAARGTAWTSQVRIVAMDPCASYRAAVEQALPQATIVADHFHLVRLANQAVTDVRRRVTWDTHGRRGRRSDPAWAARRRLLRGRERLSGKAFATMWNGLVDGDATGQILAAWIAKEELRALLATARRRRAAPRHRAPAPPLPRLVRSYRRAGARAARPHHRCLVVRDPRVSHHRRHQRGHRGDEPNRQDRRPHRLRLSQPRQPAAARKVRLHPATPPGQHRRMRDASPSSSKSRYETPDRLAR